MGIFPEISASNHATCFVILLFKAIFFNNFLHLQLVQILLGWLVLPPVVENGILLRHLPLHALPIVHVEDDEGGGQGGQYHQQRYSDGKV